MCYFSIAFYFVSMQKYISTHIAVYCNNLNCPHLNSMKNYSNNNNRIDEMMNYYYEIKSYFKNLNAMVFHAINKIAVDSLSTC